MNATTLAPTVSTMKRTLMVAALGAGAMVLGLAAPAATAQAALRTTNVGGTTVTITTLDSHNWSRLSPSNADTVELNDGSRGEVWTFDVDPGTCVDIAMRSDHFTPYLSLRKGAPFGEELATSDGATGNKSGRWAGIRGTAAGAGPYFVVATSSGSGERSGDYTLDIESCD